MVSIEKEEEMKIVFDKTDRELIVEERAQIEASKTAEQKLIETLGPF